MPWSLVRFRVRANPNPDRGPNPNPSPNPFQVTFMPWSLNPNPNPNPSPEPNQVTFMPWSLKPLYALLADRLPLCGYHFRPWLALSSAGSACCYPSLQPHPNPNANPNPQPNQACCYVLAGTYVDTYAPGPPYCTFAYRPPACCTYQRRRAACPGEGTSVRTPYSYKPSGVPYVPRTVAPQAGTYVDTIGGAFLVTLVRSICNACAEFMLGAVL
eukprot:scaffold43044_cov52-Phaeocystis_antarctica.AAC.3